MSTASKHCSKALAGLGLVAAAALMLEAPALAQDKPPVRYAATAGKAGKPAAAADATRERIPQGALVVSDYEYNQFVFAAPVAQLTFPPNAPVTKPVYAAGNTHVFIQFQRGADEPVQMIAETEAGQVVVLRLLPRPVAGIVHRVEGPRERATTTVQDHSASTDRPRVLREQAIELLKAAIIGALPGNFEPQQLAQPVRFDRFTVVPMAAWSDNARLRVLVFSLVAAPGQTAVVSPRQFYRPGVLAVTLNSDVVDANTSPTLYIVEEEGVRE